MPSKKRAAVAAPTSTDQTADPPRRVDPRLVDPLFVTPPELLGLSELLEGTGTDEDLYPRMLESQCGATDDSQPVEQYDGTLGVTQAFVANHQAAVAQVQWNADLASRYDQPGNVSGVRWGSGTMIGPDLFLTCGHLFDQTGNGWTRPKVDGSSATISPQEIATNMHVNFNFQVDPTGAPRAEVSFPITELVEYRLGGIDMAVCRIGGSPGSTFGVTAVATADVAVGAMLAIIGHPAGLPKRVEAGPATELQPGRLLYDDIDTLGGNSGSGILGPAGTIVGVHTNGGCTTFGTGSNFGVPIMTIRGVSPTLQNLTTSPLADVIVTRPSLDLATLAHLDNVGTFVGVDTSVVADLAQTRPWLDTSFFLDHVATQPWADFGGGTGPAADSLQEFIDPGFDPVVNPAIGPVVTPVPPRTDPATAGRAAGLRPFVLQSPHRFAGAEDAVTTPTTRAEHEQLLAAYETALEALGAQRTAVEQEYRDAYARYAAAFGADGAQR